MSTEDSASPAAQPNTLVAASGPGDKGVGGAGNDRAKDLGDAIHGLIELIKQGIQQARDDLHKAQADFTTGFCKAAQENYPDYNVMVVGTSHEQKFEGFAEGSPSTYEVPVWGGGHAHYDCYIFKKGKFVKWGDGGFINWCFVGNYNRWSEGDSTFVEFEEIQRDTVDGTVTGGGWTEIPRFPTRSHPDGVYFVDCKRGSDPNTEYASGIAYYKDLKDGGNQGQQPDDYIDVSKGYLVNWAKSGSATFNNGTKFYYTMYDGADSVADFAYAGNADNTYNRYRVFKDQKRLLYTVDGWECYTTYWAF